MGLYLAIAAYVISVVLLILTRIGIISGGKIFFKVTSSFLFIVLWAAAGDFQISLAVLPLLFYMTGDIILGVLRTKRGFIAGMGSFLVGNIIMITILIQVLGINMPDFFILVIFLLIAGAGIGYKRLDFGGAGIIIAVYILIICVMVTKAVSLIWTLEPDSIIPSVFFASGAFLYGVSDIVLANNKFKYRDSRWMSPMNLGLYYTGIGLIAIFSSVLN